MTTIGPELEIFSLGTPQHFRHLTLFPLLHPSPRVPFYLTLDEALAQGTVQVTEVSKGGHVPELLLINRGDRPVLLIDGEELVGAKQNRVLNLTILAHAQSEVVIPVSCVEQGRWYDLSEVFCASPRVHFAAGRAAKVASVSECLAEGHGAVSDQSGVWSDIASKAARFRVPESLGALRMALSALHSLPAASCLYPIAQSPSRRIAIPPTGCRRDPRGPLAATPGGQRRELPAASRGGGRAGVPGRRPGEDAAPSGKRHRGGGPPDRGGARPPGGVPQQWEWSSESVRNRVGGAAGIVAIPVRQ